MSLEIEEVAAASIAVPPANFNNLFFDIADGVLKYKNDAGAIVTLVVSGAANDDQLLVLTHSAGVPGGGTRYLRTGPGVLCSSAGYPLLRNMNLTGLSVQVDTLDAINTYGVEFITDPSGTPVVKTTLTLLNSKQAINNALSISLLQGEELGVRLVRTAGAGGSAFNDITVIAELRS